MIGVSNVWKYYILFMRHFHLLLHFGANYIEPVATFDGRCSFSLISKKKKKNHTFKPEFSIYFGSKVPLLVIYTTSADES